MGVKSFDFKKVSLVFGAQALAGYHEGTVINYEPAADSFVKHVGADGEVSRAAMNDFSGSVTVTLAQTSPSNDYLSSIALADRTSGAGVLPLMLRDASGRTLIVSDSAWIRQRPKVVLAKGSIEGREWIIDLAQAVESFGGN